MRCGKLRMLYIQMLDEKRTTMIQGSCTCGQCSFESSGEMFDVLHCHCSNCRKLTGSVFATYGAVLLDHFQWLCDPASMTEIHTSRDVVRYFCNTCGSMMASTDEKEQNKIYLSVGVLDSGANVKPEYHQYVASKVHWYEIKDELPQFVAESSC